MLRSYAIYYIYAENVQVITIFSPSSFYFFISYRISFHLLCYVFVSSQFSGYGILLTHLTVSQLIYDCSFLLLAGYQNVYCINVINFLSILGGTSTAMWSNVISVVVVYVVLYRCTLDIKSNLPKITFVVMSLALALAICEVAFYFQKSKLYIVDHTYYYWRLVSILFNFMVYCVISYQMYRLESKTGEISRMNPLKTLVSRFKYYPLCQSIIRAGASWYEWRKLIVPSIFLPWFFLNKSISFSISL